MHNSFLERGGLWVLGQSLLMLTVVWLGVFFHNEDRQMILCLLGVVLLCAGGCIGLAGVRVLGKSRTPFPRPPAKAQLVQHGVYALMRHPLYTSVTLASFGWSVLWQSWRAALVSAGLAIFFHAKARREERWLREKFPDYVHYEKRVRRFVPWIY